MVRIAFSSRHDRMPNLGPGGRDLPSSPLHTATIGDANMPKTLLPRPAMHLLQLVPDVNLMYCSCKCNGSRFKNKTWESGERLDSVRGVAEIVVFGVALVRAIVHAPQ